MKVRWQDSTQTRRDSAIADSVNAASNASTTALPMPEMRTPQNAGYLQAVYAEVVIIFGGYLILLFRRSAKLRQRQERFRHGR